MAREQEKHEIEVHVAGFCIDLEKEDGPCILLAKRTAQRALYPGLWECGGGQVKRGESFTHALERQIREEFGLQADVLFAFGDYFIPLADGGIPGIKFVCAVDSAQPVKLDPAEHAEFVWAQEKDLGRYDLIPGVREEIVESFKILAECQ